MSEMTYKRAETTNKPQSAQVDNGRHATRRSGWLFPSLAALGLIVSIVTVITSSNRLDRAKKAPQNPASGSAALTGAEAHVPAESPEKRISEAARIRAARREAAKAYRSAVDAEYEAFKRRVSERAAAFDVVRAGIPMTVDKYDFKKCWRIMYALAKDRIAKMLGKECQTDFDRLVNGDLRTGFYQPLQDARCEVLVLLNELQVRLLACRDELDVKLSQIPDWDRSLGDQPTSLKAESLEIEEMLAALREVQSGATVAAAIDAVCVGGVCQTVGSLLAGAGGRFAAGTAAGAASAMADSPLPGPGDIIGAIMFAVGATATAWEVHKAQKVIPEQLSRVLNETVDTQSAEVQKRTLDEGEKLYLVHTRKAEFLTAEES